MTASYESLSGEEFQGERWNVNPVLHDALIWFDLPTPEKLMDKELEVLDKLRSSIDRSGRVKVVVAKERRKRGLQRPLGRSRWEWGKELLEMRSRHLWTKLFKD